MLNKKEAAMLLKISELLTELVGTGKVPAINGLPGTIEKKTVDNSPFSGMNKNSRELFAVLQKKYGGKVITVTDNEFLRKSLFDCRVSGLFPWVRQLEKRGLCVFETDGSSKKPRLVSFILKEKF